MLMVMEETSSAAHEHDCEKQQGLIDAAHEHDCEKQQGLIEAASTLSHQQSLLLVQSRIQARIQAHRSRKGSPLLHPIDSDPHSYPFVSRSVVKRCTPLFTFLPLQRGTMVQPVS